MAAIKLLLVFYHRASWVAGSLIEISDRQGLCTFHGRGWLLLRFALFSVVCGGARSSGSHFPKSTPFWFKEQKVGYQSRDVTGAFFFFLIFFWSDTPTAAKKKKKKKNSFSWSHLCLGNIPHIIFVCYGIFQDWFFKNVKFEFILSAHLKDFLTFFLIPVQWNTLLSSRLKKGDAFF